MFANPKIESKLTDEMIALLAELETLRDQPEKYSATLERIAKLDKLKSEQGLKPPSADTVLVVCANIFGIVWLTVYERENVISSKALGFVMRTR